METLNVIDFETYIINYLETNLTDVIVTGSYPTGTQTYPLITTSMTTTPLLGNVSKNTVKERVSLEVRLWTNKKTDLLSTQREIQIALDNFGFGRLNPTQPTIDNTNNKYFVREQYYIEYNLNSEMFERSF